MTESLSSQFRESGGMGAKQEWTRNSLLLLFASSHNKKQCDNADQEKQDGLHKILLIRKSL